MDQLTLKALRVNKGWSVDEACKRLGVSKHVLYNFEQGRSLPNVLMIRRFMDVYNVSYDNINFLLPKDNENIVIKKED